MPRGFYALIGAQFASGLADHALLIVTMAFLAEQGWAPWWAPLLKLAYTWAYVLLAPWVGHWADTVPKASLMGWMNALKGLGAVALLLGCPPWLAFAVLGLGAAAYAPAKYGWVTESMGPARLVAANGWLEVSLVLAVLLGTGLGGWLVSDAMRSPWWATPAGWRVGTELAPALAAVWGSYLLAGLLNLAVPSPVVRRAQPKCAPGRLRDFASAHCRLWRDPLGGLSMAVTTVFWGVGAVLQFAVLRWAEQRLDLPLSQAAYLQATVAMGVVLGALLVARRVDLPHAIRVLPLGIALGGLVAVCAQITLWWAAVPLLVLTGVVGGALVVPMNALLQYRGQRLLTAGRSIAVQGGNENASVLLMLGLYALLLTAEVPVVPMMTGLGLLLALGMAALWWWSPVARRARTPVLRGPVRRQTSGSASAMPRA